MINLQPNQRVHRLSKFEYLISITRQLILEYNSWSEIANQCGESRLDGGMHFRASVPAGEKLCADIGTIVAQKLGQLMDGNIPDGHIVDFNDKSIPNRDVNC